MPTTFDTIFPADTLEFCPNPGFQTLFACGTYKLLEQDAAGEEQPAKRPQKRRGQCLLFQTKLIGDEPRFQKIHSVNLPAIPDMKWSPSTLGTPLLAIADSEGSITLHTYDEGSLKQIRSIRCAPPDTLCLSLDWSNKRFAGSNLTSLVVSLSNGSLALLSPSESSMTLQETWLAHDYEPWIVSWDNWDTSVIYSGGDDLKLKAWDIRQGFDSPVFTNRRFDAGVTTIQSHPHNEHLIAVGSYDNTLRLFDTRKPLTPLSSTDVGGGVWRAKWHPSPTRKTDILLACMHDGFKIIRFSPSTRGDARTAPLLTGEGQVNQHYTQHESLAYGADWSHSSPLEDGRTLIGCCSFYDHKMSLFTG